MWREVEQIFGMLPVVANRREEISGFGLVLGAVIDRNSREVVVHSATYNFETQLKRLFQLLRQLGVLQDGFACSSFQILCNAEVRRHVDRNAGLSIVFATGDFSNGRLFVDEKPVNNYRRGVIFDGGSEHFVESHSGTRWSGAFYMHPRTPELSHEALSFLASLGLNPMPTLPPSSATSGMDASGAELASEARLIVFEINLGFDAIATMARSLGWSTEVVTFISDSDVLACTSKMGTSCTGEYSAFFSLVGDIMGRASPEVSNFGRNGRPPKLFERGIQHFSRVADFNEDAIIRPSSLCHRWRLR